MVSPPSATCARPYSACTAAGAIGDSSSLLAERSERQKEKPARQRGQHRRLTPLGAHNADSAEQTRKLAAQASVAGRQRPRRMTDAVTTMGQDRNARKIVEITSLIDSIAFQTNILALNAAVRSRRANNGPGASTSWRARCARWRSRASAATKDQT